MSAVMQVVTQVVLLAILIGFAGLIGGAAAAAAWLGWHVLHDHVSLGRAWRDARVRLFH